MFSRLFSAPPSAFSAVSTLIVKVTYRCNLDCLYCYEKVSKTGQDMSIEQFKELVDLSLGQTSSPQLTFLFHGGEPTLLPIPWYEEGLDYALAQAKKWGKTVHFAMQSNLVRLKEEYIQLFQRYKIALGVSLDQPVFLLDDSQRGGETKVFKNFKRLQAAKVKAGVLATINSSNYPNFYTLCEWLWSEAKQRSFKANVVTPVGAAHGQPPLQAEQIFMAQKAIIDYMIATQGQALIESNIALELGRYFEPEQAQSTLCHEKTCGAGRSALGITPEGHLLPCGRFAWNEPAYYLGHLSEQRQASRKEKKQLAQKIADFHAQKPENWYDCESCPAQKVCGYGCQAFILRSEEQANLDCLPTKMRFAYYQEKEVALKAVFANIQKRQAGPSRQFRIKDQNGQWKSYKL